MRVANGTMAQGVIENPHCKTTDFSHCNYSASLALGTVLGHSVLVTLFLRQTPTSITMIQLPSSILPVDVACWSVVYHAMAPFSAQRLPKLPHAALTTCIAARLTPNGRGTPRKRLSHHLRRVCARAGDRTIMECASHQPYAILASVSANDIRVTTASSHDTQHLQLGPL